MLRDRVAVPVSVLRRLALVPLLAVVSLSLVIVAGGHDKAAAWAGAPAPVEIAGALKSPPARLISWTPQGRVVMVGIGLGMLAYQTRDSWWPTVRGWFPEGEVESATSLGGYDLYSQGEKKTIECKGSDPLLGSGDYLTSGPMQGYRGIKLTFAQDCVGPPDYPNYGFPSVGIRAVSLCRNKSTGSYKYRAADGAFPATEGGSVGVKVPGTGAVAKTRGVVIDYAVSFLCAGVSNEYPVHSTVGLANPQNNLTSFPIRVIRDVNVGAPKREDWGQTATVRCRTGGSDASPTLTTISDTIYGDDAKLALPSCAERVPGSIPWDGTVTNGPRGSTDLDPIGTFSTDTNLYEQWRDCFGPTGVICKTEVYVDGQRCVFGSSVCIIWPQIARAEPERVQCRFGSHVLPLSDCQLLKRAYSDVVTISGTTDVFDLLDPNPNPTPKPSPTPNPTQNPTPNPTGNPTPTPGPNPEVVTPTPEDVDPDSKNCFGDAVSWNPVQWVYVPVKCALKWAFVPKTSLQVRSTRIKTTFDTKFPFTVPAMVGGMGGSVGGGCPDWNVIVGADAWAAVCDSTFTTALRGARGMLFGGMVAAAFWPLVRGLFFASVPIIKPTPTGER